MVRISKTMQAKHLESLPPYVRDFRDKACSLPLLLLPSHLSTFATQWPFPRGDLYHWIPLLNRFDVVLETFCKTYKLEDGPQVVDFTCSVLESSESPVLVSSEQREQHDLGSDGDVVLVMSILQFSRMLLQNCGNRSIYASSAHLNNLLNSTSLSLVEETLHLALELAQRYQAAVKRTNVSMRHINPAVLANHYNIDLDRVLQLALPFTRVTPSSETALTTPVTPTAKGKERAPGTPTTVTKSHLKSVHVNDLVALAKDGGAVSSSPKASRKSPISWDDWGNVSISYYPKPPTEQTNALPRALPPVTNVPTSPTPVRRSSNLGPNGARGSRATAADDSPTPIGRAVTFPYNSEDTPPPTFKMVDLSHGHLKRAGLHSVLREHCPELPKSLQYELLSKLRNAVALTSSLDGRRQALSVRLLAISNLAYIHSESTFLETVLKQDSEEPRRLQLVYQLVDLIHPPIEGEEPIPRAVQIVALNALSALAEHSVKFPDVCAALNTNVNHGVLLYIVRKVVAELKEVDETDQETEDDIWRCAVFSLLSIITNNQRTGTEIVSAGLVPILVEVLNMREGVVAGRYQVTVLTFLDNILYGIRDAFQILVNADGLDAVSNLIVAEVKSSADHVLAGKGIKAEYGSAAVDYKIPFFQQQTLKWLFKFIHHMMTTAGGFGGNFDRLLRNLIDSSPLLASLRQIIGDGQLFGSVVWTNAVTILNDFINNEPTSFTVIAEAGLSNELLQSVTGAPIEPVEQTTPQNQASAVEDSAQRDGTPGSDSEDGEEPPPVESTSRPDLTKLSEPRNRKLANGIMTSSEAINIIPQAFGAICLNSSGMKTFRASTALERFFEIFESPEHIKCMDTNKDLPSNLGSTFDELMRHHPPLRPAIMDAVLTMVARVNFLCEKNADQYNIGAKLWTTDAAGNAVIANKGLQQTANAVAADVQHIGEGNGDVEMKDAVPLPQTTNTPSQDDVDAYPTMIPYITAVASFLSTLFGNSAARLEFITHGGVEMVLNLVQSPALMHDSSDCHAMKTLNAVVGLLAESKPHLTLPSLLRRTVRATEVLEPFFTASGSALFFAPFISEEARRSAGNELLVRGSDFAKAFVNVQTLVAAIHACLQSSSYNHGHRSATTILSQLNLADYQSQIIKSFGPLVSSALQEELKLQKLVPENWRNVGRLKHSFSRVLDTILGSSSGPAAVETSQVQTPTEETSNSSSGETLVTSDQGLAPSSLASKLPTQSEQDSIYFKNFQTIRFSLSKIPDTVATLLQSFGKASLNKRSPDLFQKQSQTVLAETLAVTVIEHLSSYEDERSTDYYSYRISMLRVLEDLLIDSSRHGDRHPQPITNVLLAFKNNGGFECLNRMLEVFIDEVREAPRRAEDETQQHLKTENVAMLELATAGVKKILGFYTIFADGKSITEASQTTILAARDKERTRGDGFLAAQFLVEVRLAILPTIHKLWDSDLIEKGSSEISDKLIEVLKTISMADFEAGAFRRSEELTTPSTPARKQFKVNSESMRTHSATYDADLVTEALYRCNNNPTIFVEYLREAQASGQRFAPPAEDLQVTAPVNESSRPQTGTSSSSETPEDEAMLLISGILPPASTSVPPRLSAGDANDSNEFIAPESKDVEHAPRITIENLNEERDSIRVELIDKCLDIINAHGDLTFQVADLITTVVGKAGDPVQQRRSVAETLVVALLSFAGEEDLKASGDKIAAYAHLLALLLRDNQFYTAAVAELKDNENLEVLLGFVRMSPTHSVDESSPWISNVLLIVEILLSEDARPQKTKWSAPKDEKENVAEPVLELRESAVSQEAREQLFEALLEILPRVGKDESLALSLLRILVILTRERVMALRMGEKKNIQRLFVMAKQLAGANSSRIQSPLMLILRHIIEDEETVKQIMRADVKAYMETGRHERTRDITNYLRQQAHLVARSPELFVQITNEMVKYLRWSFSAPEGSNRNALVLKESDPAPAPKTSEDPVQPTVQATEDLTLQDVKVSTEQTDSDMPDAPKAAAATEPKLPVLEHPDGVIHFLLCELLNYRDVDDKEPVAIVPDKATSETKDNADSGEAGPSSVTDDSIVKDNKSKLPVKQDFKAEEHPIYIYRCFILQCLTELLSSYNRTKIEFINFKRSAPPQAMTPSKPRSSVVNYLLFDLIPVGTLEHADTPASRKRQITSGWADSVLTALLAKTGEHSIIKDKEPYGTENEADLLFVRRFVLENILKAYKEASSGQEALEVKYARMLSLADLMNHIMTGKESLVTTDSSTASVSQKQLRRIMYEKGYVTALTNSIADMDLNFPGAKRAIKYILRPLKTLTTTAITLSDLELISETADQAADVEDIESATSVSDEDDREETPDLFRNSTLGMFEPSREDDSGTDSEDEDEEMYEGDFGDEMEYEDELDQDDVISEDDEIDGMGPIEGLPGDHGVDVEVIMEDDDDDHDDDSSDSEDDDDEDDDDSEDDDGRIEIIDELGEVQELVEGEDMGEWGSDENDDENQNEDAYDDAEADGDEDHLDEHEIHAGGHFGQLLRSLGEGENAAELLERIDAGMMDAGDGEPNPDDFMDDGDEDEDEEDEDEEMMFDYAMEGAGPPLGWQDEAEPINLARRSRPFAPFPMFPGLTRDPLSAHRFHDFSGAPRRGGARGGDDGVNPLLQRTAVSSPRRTAGGLDRPSATSWMRVPGMRGDMDIVDIAMGGGGRFAGNPGNAAILEEVMRSMPPLPPHFRDGNFQFHITAPPGHAIPRELEILLGATRSSRFDARRDPTESSVVAAFFAPQSTAARWMEEAKLLFNAAFADRALDIASTIQSVLVPPAIEVEKVARAAEAERIRKLKEEIEKRNEAERIAREAKEAEEKAAKEKKEAEEREAAEKAAADALAAQGHDADVAPETASNAQDSEAMDGVETEGDESAEAAGAQAEPADRPRVTTIIRGNPYDITDLGIDAAFLAELPEELREEVIMSAVAERRSQATATGAQPSDIDQEFLNALPEDIRAEIVAQERADRRRQANAAARSQAAAGGAPAHDMDAASILATLDPILRNQVLLEQDEDTLAMLPRELAEQARAAMGRDGGGVDPRIALQGRAARRSGGLVDIIGRSPKPVRRAVVQMLDKPGVATLLRLMFIFQQGSLRSTLNNVLQNVSLNRHNRVEVLTTLLHILQDGSIDVAAVERSFAHLSLKAKLPKDNAPKTPQTLKRALTGTPTVPQQVVPGNFEASPLLVVQQCLTCLVYLNQVNPHVPAFFLTEHDIGTGLKRTLSRKGKGKENKSSKYALNTLLALLDRDVIMESSSVMESLSTLLNMVTGPLTALQRKQKDILVVKDSEEPPATTEDAAASAPSEAPAPAAETTTAAPTDVSATTQEPDASATVAEASSTEPKEPVKPEEPEKTKRTIVPPVVPEHNLQLVINIFVARECSSKTFRETLSTIKNLSSIPGAKTVFGRELITKAQALAETILVDLEELLPQIERATTGTEIQGVALAKFSPGGSDQNKLLRVLTALDHLFDPKREKKDTPEAESEGDSSSQLMEKQDLLSSLYENSTFAPMWEKLSACLSAIRQRENLMNVATILLPLIEALMVVCKNTTLKDQPNTQTQGGKELMLTSPPPESRMESLFFTFTGDHRKILNELVRHTPKLMSGTFSLLVKNPKVLEFDNKRNYFSRSVHAKAPNSRSAYPPLQLSVRREHVFHDSFKSLYFQTGDQMKYGKLSIRFHGEEGVDAGGVTREWFQVLSRQMFDPDYALWTPVSSDRTTFHPSQYSSINDEHLMFFKFIGRIIGKALYEGRVLDCHFSRAVYRRILGKAVSIKDLESLDPDYHKSVLWMLENDITDIITETFSVDNDKFGVVETIDFVPNGRNIAVTEENKHEYVRLMVEWKLTGSVKEQLDVFLKGFHEIIPADLVSIFNEQELELLISGLPEIEVDDWKSNTELHNYTAASPQIQWFWRAVRSFDKEERAKLLQFVTGTSKVPLNGFKELEGMNGFSRFNIHRDYGNKDRLPSSHTCFNQLDLPEYENYEILRQQLLTAITAGSEYFGFA